MKRINEETIERINGLLNELHSIAEWELSHSMWDCKDGDDVDAELSGLYTAIDDAKGNIQDAIEELTKAVEERDEQE